MINALVGHYKITAKLGRGGMGAVYRATDTQLDREVAIKILPEEFARNRERLARFEREAKVLATLNHPNIASIYGLEQTGNSQALILELVEGEDLSERLKRGPLPVEEGLDVCKQIAEALEAAHEKGIIHRDLKPGNVKLTDDGKVKVLDFGLAKTATADTSNIDPDSPTITADYTMPGTLLGTAGYMSPEQARGKAVDKRSDIWSFGVLLFECLTGKRLFSGETMTDSIGALLHKEIDWSRLPPDTPPTIQLLLRKCLVRDRRRRLRDIGDACIELEQAIADPGSSLIRLSESALRNTHTRRGMPRPLVAGLIIIACLVALGLGWFLKPAPAPHQPVSKLSVVVPDGRRLTEGAFSLALPMALSPDGKRLVYSATTGGRPQLYLQNLDEFDAKPIAGTEGGTSPFFSPSGEKLGFFARGKLMKVSLPDGVPQPICDAPSYFGNGAAWGPDGTIIFAPALGGLVQVSEQTGEVETLTTPAFEKGEYAHAQPQFLPDGKNVLFGVWGINDRAAILSLETRQWKLLPIHPDHDVSGAHYLPTGHIVYGDSTSLFAVPFDLKHLQVKGPPVQVLNGIDLINYSGRACFVVSDTGTLVYQPVHVAERTLVWVDRQGNPTPVRPVRGPYVNPNLSPTNDRLLFLSFTPPNEGICVWDFDNHQTPITKGASSAPIWAPDGKRITFAFREGGSFDLTSKSADGTGHPQTILPSSRLQFPMCWSPDGKVLAYYEYGPTTGRDIWMWPVGGKPQPFLTNACNEYMLRFSPDGHFVAYVSDISGRQEVYVEAYPRHGERIPISTDGGREPVWSHDGRELFYRNGDQMMVVPTDGIAVGKPGRPGKPQCLFTNHFASDLLHDFDVSRDGQRFLMIQEDEATARPQFKIVLNWFAELNEKVPSEGD